MWHTGETPPGASASYQCATITVPLDYAHPGGRHLRLRISRIRTSTPAERRGVLLFRAAWPRAAHCAPHIGHRIQEAVLLTHFSEPGQNFDYGGRTDLRTGNTEALARTISERIGCAVYRIGAADSYPEGYDETVARNVREQDANARPAIAEGLAVRGEEVSDAGARIEAWLRRSGLAPLSRYERFTGGVTGLPIRNAGILWDS